MSDVIVANEEQKTGFIIRLRERMRAGGEKGAGIVEYAALVILAAAILGGLIASGVTDKLTKAVGEKVDCMIASDCTQKGGGGGEE